MDQAPSIALTQEADPTAQAIQHPQGVDKTNKEPPFFFMAMADGEFGHLYTSGNLKMAGERERDIYYDKWRIAYYFKGVVQGKYLITSAFDTKRNQFNRMFKNLDQEETERFFTHLDPDKFYPV
jgi:hypothetical protein